MAAACRSCGAPVIWAQDGEKPDGSPKWVPLNTRRIRGYEVEDEEGRSIVIESRTMLTSHFTTCPNASSHSGGKEKAR